jgi:hypothetical protein
MQGCPVHNPDMTSNYERAFADRPEVYAAGRRTARREDGPAPLRACDARRGAAACSSYCCLAHGLVLQSFDEPVTGDRSTTAPPSDEVDIAVMDLAGRRRRYAIGVASEPLRDLGLTETEIMDVVLAAAARCFFSKTLDAVGVQPDASYHALEPALRDALVVGRPIAEA